MKIVIIGSKGFIGSHLYNYYKNQPSQTVWGCDVVTDYAVENYFLIDASNADFDEVFQSQKFDVCINASGAASVPDSFVHPLRDYYLNTKNVFNILEAIRRHSPACKFLNISSAAVYGSPTVLPISETHEVKPLSSYGWHKYQSELLCTEFYQVYSLATCSARIFSAFGIGLKKQLFWDWYQKALTKNEVVLLGTGNESRDFIFIDDIGSAIDCIVKNAPFQADAINVANGEEIRIKEAAKLFKKHLNARFDYHFNNEIRKGDPLNWRADIAKIMKWGFKPRYSMEEGLRKYIEWLQRESD